MCRQGQSHVDAPELLDRVESDYFFEKIIPVISLCLLSTDVLNGKPVQLAFPLGGLVNHRVQVFIRGCFTLKFSASWKTVTFSPFDATVAFSLLASGVASELLTGAGATSAMIDDVFIGEVKNGD